jgi:hypothetical protein
MLSIISVYDPCDARNDEHPCTPELAVTTQAQSKRHVGRCIQLLAKCDPLLIETPELWSSRFIKQGNCVSGASEFRCWACATRLVHRAMQNEVKL